VRGGLSAGAPTAEPGERERRGPFSFVQERHLAAAADPAAASAVLGRGALDAREFHRRRQRRTFPDGDPLCRLEDARTARPLPRRLARSRTPRARARDARVSYVLRRDRG